MGSIESERDAKVIKSYFYNVDIGFIWVKEFFLLLKP